MPFFLTMRAGDEAEKPLGEASFASLEEAYLDACAAIPEAAADELRARRDPFRCAFMIYGDAGGDALVEVPFTDLIAPSARPLASLASRTEPAGRGDHEGVRRSAALRAEAHEFRGRLAESIRRSRLLVARAAALAAPGCPGCT